jgi:hypothetical protein
VRRFVISPADDHGRVTIRDPTRRRPRSCDDSRYLATGDPTTRDDSRYLARGDPNHGERPLAAVADGEARLRMR